MSAETAAIWLVYSAAPAATIFPLTYGLTVRWWTFWIGRALMVSSTALGLLIDLTLVNYWTGYTLPAWLTLAVLALISLGANLKLFAILVEKTNRYRH